jgi:hypothetical protein
MRFTDIEVGMIAWLGSSPTDRRIKCQFETKPSLAGSRFYVQNGAWYGTLFPREDGNFLIVDERGTTHDPIFFVEIIEHQDCLQTADDDIHF